MKFYMIFISCLRYFYHSSFFFFIIFCSLFYVLKKLMAMYCRYSKFVYALTKYFDVSALVNIYLISATCGDESWENFVVQRRDAYIIIHSFKLRMGSPSRAILQRIVMTHKTFDPMNQTFVYTFLFVWALYSDLVFFTLPVVKGL